MSAPANDRKPQTDVLSAAVQAVVDGLEPLTEAEADRLAVLLYRAGGVR